MSDSFIGEIKIYAFNFAPRGWAQANGQLLPINQNQALFALLGTQFGGNGTTTFALPDLRDRTPLHQGTSSFGSYVMGERAGETAHALTLAEMPAHSHGISATSTTAPAPAVGPENALPATATHEPYRSGTVQTVSMKAGLTQSTGQGAAHPNMQPYLTMNFCIALQGIFPSRN